MIRINLLGETKDFTAYYFIQGLVFTVSVCIAGLVCFFVSTSASNDNLNLVSKKDNLERQAKRLAKKTKEVDGLDKKKKLLSDKLSTIAKLKAQKQAPVLVLDAITQVIPERAWIDTIIKREEGMEFRGTSLDNQTISVFIKQLDDSPFFSGVDLGFSRQVDQDGVPLKQFSLNGKLEDPLAANKKMIALRAGKQVKESEEDSETSE
jgi:type IV pilus assembly protein PilN